MSEIQQNRYDQLLRRVADLKGPGSKVSDALGELFPTIDVENVPYELLLLLGSRTCMGYALAGPGGATFFTTVFIHNPPDSGVIARLTHLSVEAADMTVLIGPTLNVADEVGARAFTDGRVFGEGTTLRMQGNNNNLVIGAAFSTLVTGSEGFIQYAPPGGIMTLSPGTSFSVGAGADNEFLRANFIWVERQAEPSELNI